MKALRELSPFGDRKCSVREKKKKKDANRLRHFCACAASSPIRFGVGVLSQASRVFLRLFLYRSPMHVITGAYRDGGLGSRIEHFCLWMNSICVFERFSTVRRWAATNQVNIWSNRHWSTLVVDVCVCFIIKIIIQAKTRCTSQARKEPSYIGILSSFGFLSWLHHLFELQRGHSAMTVETCHQTYAKLNRHSCNQTQGGKVQLSWTTLFFFLLSNFLFTV